MKKTCFLSFVAILALQADTRLDTSVISTTGFEDSLRNEVRNVTVITKEDIKDKGYRSLKEVLQKAPSITFLGAAVGTKIDLRGQGEHANTHVQIMLNDISMNMIDTSHTAAPLETISVDDIERIEIIPGGGSVLYGSGTQGGVINIITKSKPRDFYANISSRYGSGPYHDARFNIGGLISDNLFLKSSFWAFNDGRYRHNERERGAYASFGTNYQISDNQYLNTDFSYYKGRSQIAGSVTKKELDENRRTSHKDSISKSDTTKTTFTIEYGIKPNDNLEFKITPLYQYTKYQGADRKSIFTDKKYGAKLKSKYDYESGNVIFGYDYIVNSGINNAYMDFMMPFWVNDTKGKAKKTINSIFIQNQLEFSDSFSLNTGARYEHAKYGITKNTHRVDYMGMTRPPNPPIIYMPPKEKFFYSTYDRSEDNYAFEITPNFKYSDTGNIYFKFERGFTSPPVSKMVDKDIIKGYVLNDIQSETYNTYEIGLKDLIFGHFFSATVFLTDTKNEITTLGSPPAFWTQHNIGKTRRYGFELYAEEELLDGDLRLTQTLSYINTEVKKSSAKESFKVGEVIPNVPEYKFVLGADYDITNNFSTFANIKFYGKAKDYRYEKISPYNVTDIGAQYSFKNLKVIAGINNIFDKEYYSGIGYNYMSGAKLYTPSDGRNYFVEFKYDF